MNQKPRITFVPYGYGNCPELYKPLLQFLPPISLKTVNNNNNKTDIVVAKLDGTCNQEDSVCISKKCDFTKKIYNQN